MDQFKKVLKKLFCLPPLPTILISVPSYLFVFIVLASGHQSILTYVAYILSAYAMIITITGITGVIEAIRDGFNEIPLLKKIRSNPLGNRLLGDAVFRSEITLHGGLFVNLLYVALYIFSGIFSEFSAWSATMAAYYILLSVMRLALVRYVHQKEIGENIMAEFRRYRFCGILLAVMNLALMTMVFYMVYQNEGPDYSGILIYAMAAYTFYITIVAIVNVIRFRKRGSPILSAAKAISLTAALVSMLSLETAMLGAFGGTEPELRRTMTLSFGGAICMLVFGMAVYMIVRASKQLRKMKINDSET